MALERRGPITAPAHEGSRPERRAALRRPLPALRGRRRWASGPFMPRHVRTASFLPAQVVGPPHRRRPSGFSLSLLGRTAIVLHTASVEYLVAKVTDPTRS